ncbi:cation-translocating P-type ATPase [Clostridium arbusti]|uniref:cation-translocating P-type ATPase n=1 Tax=Clostridium arbusti TaxID=1137848 RepID=UPI000287BB89|nr:cation-transporting P-type ATPase [Clostridium arbusti]
MDHLEEQTIKSDVKNNIQKLTVSEVYKALVTDTKGLTQSEAEARIKQFGKNTLPEKKKKSFIWKFLANFTHLMAILLWVGGIASFIAKMPELGIAIWMVNVINGLFSFWQEFRAEKATEALRQLIPDYARVLRNGEEQKILAEELVPGDIMMLSEGDRISADARLVEASDIRINQSTLTGESRSIHKVKDVVLRDDISRLEQSNLVFAGTSVAEGSGKAIIFSIGTDTEFGKIAGLTQMLKEESSPLQKEMGRLTRTVSIMAVSIGVFLFIIATMVVGLDINRGFIFAMGMIVAFIPEGLLPTVTLSLAMGVQRMAKRNALIKRLSSVETLGCTQVICTDKTGTLTKNEMTVSNIWIAGRNYSVTGIGYDASSGNIQNGDDTVSQEDQDIKQLLTTASLCCNAHLVPPNEDTSRWTVLGDPTEAALVVLAKKGGLNLETMKEQIPRFKELPFDSVRKRMSTIHEITDSTNTNIRIAFIKGAPKEVLDTCTSIRENGQEKVMDENIRGKIMAVNDEYASKGLRVLAVAVRKLSDEMFIKDDINSYTIDRVEKELTFLGLIAMEDPPRSEIPEAVEKCRQSGIRIIMITGDYGLTAESIARNIGIIQSENPRIVTGVEMEKMNQEELKKALSNEVILARMAPAQKLRVVSTLQEMGNVVAVTGDGVNDSPALKKADIGVAMGLSGTDVAKEAADMILTDDNFASIVNAIEEGRAVYNNIRKFIVYIFNSNMAEAIPVIIYLLSRGAIPLPLIIMQVLAIDLGTDMLPAIGLGSEKPEEGIMDSPPRSRKEPLLNRKLVKKALLWYGVIESFLAMTAYFFLNWLYGWPGVALANSGTVYRMATTMTLAAIVCAQVGVVFACRTEVVSVFKIGFLSNRIVLAGIVAELALLNILIYTPFLQNLFNTAPIGLREWAFLTLCGPIIFLVDEVRKWFLRSHEKGKHSI